MADSPFSFLRHGATIQRFRIKGINIVQGFDTMDEYIHHNRPYFGETIGRVANRLKNAKLDKIDGREIVLNANDGTSSLHGGPCGWGKQIWEGPISIGVREIPGLPNLEGGQSVEFNLISKHGDEGYPGTVEARVIYTTGTQREAEDGEDVTVLGIEYEAKLVGEADETVINLTNHSYFNLAGCPKAATCDGTVVTLATNSHLPVDEHSIPTGGPTPFPSLDTSKAFILTPDGPDIDHCFTLARNPGSIPIDTRAQPLAQNLTAHHPGTDIHLEILSTEPSFQFYTGQYTDVPAIGDLPARGPRSAFCCEPSRYVNAPNVPDWRNMVLLQKGDTYGSRIVYRAWSGRTE